MKITQNIFDEYNLMVSISGFLDIILLIELEKQLIDKIFDEKSVIIISFHFLFDFSDQIIIKELEDVLNERIVSLLDEKMSFIDFEQLVESKVLVL